MNPAHLEALGFAAQGFYVLPTERNLQTRRVLTSSWEDASTDPKVIDAWNRKWPRANYGVNLKMSGLVCLDIDNKHEGQDADAAKARLEEKGLLPETLVVRSQSGGFHIYFKRPEGELSNLAELPGFSGVEFKANAIMTLPGSFYKSGSDYRVITNGQIVDCPDLDLKPVSIARKLPLSVQGKIPAGQRNSTLTSLAGTMRRKGVSPEAILATLQVENEKCDPPLPEPEITAIVNSVGSYEPESDAAFLDCHLTDLGNAERLHMIYGDVARWVYPWDQAIIWTGQRWEKDESGRLRSMAHDVIRKLYMAAFDLDDKERAEKIAKKALSFEMTSRIAGMITEARPMLMVDVADLDTHPMMLNVENGTIDLTTGSISPARPADLITKIAPVVYDTDATCPRWDRFLLEVMDGDVEVVDFLQRAIGLSLTGDVTEDHFWFLYGSGRNGKTCFMETIEKLLGDYSQRTRIETFLVGKYDQIPSDIAALAGARFVAATEASKARRFDVGRLKMFTGGDTVSARFLYKEFFDFKPQLKLWIAANNQPGIDEQTPAIWARVLLVPFRRQFIGKDDDKKLESRLLTELPGILNWAIAGCAKWQEYGLLIPDAVKEATKDYQKDEDLLEDFVRANLEKDPGGEGVFSQQIYELYLAHCEDTGVKRPWTQTRFSRELKERGYQKQHTRAGAIWHDVKIG